MSDFVVRTAVQKLTTLIIEEAVFLEGVSDKVEQLRDNLRWMQSFLKDADEEQQEGERFRNWVSQISEVAVDAEDVIETYIANAASQCSWNLAGNLIDLHKVGKEINKIQSRLQNIYSQKQHFGIGGVDPAEGERRMNTANARLRWWRQPPPDIEKADDFVGLAEDTKALIAQLSSKETRCRVVSIVGMGGLGKTTLAKKLYNHIEIRNQFDCKAFVYVSKEYNRRDTSQRIIKDASPSTKIEDLEKLEEEEMVKKLHQLLKDMRYLVVLDDIWEKEVWDSVEAAFPNGKMGSKVMITTRNREVALHADASSIPHEPRMLTEEESLELLLKKTVPGMDHLPSDLEKLGREMVAKSRRFAVHAHLDEDMFLKPHAPRNLRSLHYFCLDNYWTIDFVCKNFKLLRVLDMPRSMPRTPRAVGNLTQLRYLELRRNYYNIPRSIGNLKNLQTLKLISSSYIGFTWVPDIIWKLTNLRHFIFPGFSSKDIRIDTLIHLQTLKCIQGGRWIDDGLANLTNLRRLSIQSLRGEMVDKVISVIERFQYLWSLSLHMLDDESFGKSRRFSNCEYVHKLHLNGKIVEKLPEFPPNLVKLTLSNCFLYGDSILTLERLPNLKMLVLSVKSYTAVILVCSSGGFPQLHTLHLDRLLDLFELKAEEGSIMNLKILKIRRCPRLEDIPEHLKLLQGFEIS